MFDGLTKILGLKIFREWVLGCCEQALGFKDVVLESGNHRVAMS